VTSVEWARRWGPSWPDRFLPAVAAAASVLGDRAAADAPLGALTTYRVGGPAALLVEPADAAGLALVGQAVAVSGVAVLVVGRGSNLLVADRGFPGLAVVMGETFAGVSIEDTLVVAGGGASLPVVSRRTAAAGLTGFEWAVGVPGSIGGAVRMNAGGHGSDMTAVLERVRVVDLGGVGGGGGGGGGGDGGWRPAAALDLSYRHSNLGPAEVVVAAELRCRRGDREAAEAEIAEIVRWRREHQPGGQNAGSVFTNPPGDAAGRLVDAAGLRGFRRGSAMVSPKHANFVQADAGGSADDVLALIELVRERVRAATGVELQTEVRLIGFPGTYPHEMERPAGG
jgi:UDP-N-acetylmuramate dehydrogenase